MNIKAELISQLLLTVAGRKVGCIITQNYLCIQKVYLE